MSEPTADPKLSAVESAFRAPMAAPAAISRDRLLFEAGRRSVRRGPWPLATGALGVLSIVLGWRLTIAPEHAPEMTMRESPIVAKSVTTPIDVRPQPRLASAQMPLVTLLVLGAPDQLPAQPARERQIDEWLRGGPPETAVGDFAVPLPPPWLGLPPGSLANPPRQPSNFGPIRRGDV